MTSRLWAIRLGRFAIFVGIIVLLYFAYRYSIHTIVNGSLIFGLLAFWALTAYIALPHIHRYLTKFYLPNYYIGRARTSDGLLGDPINIAVHGSAKQLRTVMTAAGWVEADRVTFGNALRIIKASVFSRSYPAAPGSSLYLFGNKQTYSFQKENANPRTRHHVRFWKTPINWWLPGGYSADWLGAAHYDKRIGIGLFNGQVTHKITEHLDAERDFLITDLQHADRKVHVQTIANFTSGLHGRNGGGDRIRTDGAMPFIDLRDTSKK